MMKDAEKSGFVRRMVRLVLWSAVWLAAFAALLAVTLPLWIGPVVTGVAGSVVPKYTGTDFRISDFSLNPYSGTLGIKGVRLSNPKGFGDAAAFSMEGFNVELSVKSLFSDTVLVREIVVDEAFASYYSHDGRNNFEVILENVEKAKGPEKEKDASGEKDDGGEGSGKKVIIERLRIAGTKVKLMKSDMMPALALPTIELTDIGKKSEGATFEEAWNQIAEAVMKSVTALGDGLGAIGGLLEDGAKDLTKALDETTKGVTDAIGDGAKGLSSALKDVSGNAETSVKSIKESGSDAVSGVVNVTKDVSSGAADAASKTVDAVGDVASGTIDAVGDTTKKAAEGVRNIFKGFGK